MVMFVTDIVDVVQRLSPKKNISEIGAVPVLEWNGGNGELNCGGPVRTGDKLFLMDSPQ